MQKQDVLTFAPLHIRSISDLSRRGTRTPLRVLTLGNCSDEMHPESGAKVVSKGISFGNSAHILSSASFRTHSL